MSTTQHPLTETEAAEMWDEHHTSANPILRWSLAHETEREATLALLRAAFDAGRGHEREHATQDRPTEITDEMVEAGASYAWEEANPGVLGWNSLTEIRKEGCRRDARNVLSAALAVALPADPHHDPRPWQDCTHKDIREGVLVETLVGGLVSVGVAHHQDGAGDWRTEGGMSLTYGDIWPLRRIPAPTTEKETPIPAPWATIKEIPMPETITPAEPLARTLLRVPEGHGAPHHDGDRIKAEDFALQVDRDGFIRAGRAHHQDQDGDWQTKDGRLITWAARRADRPDAITVWPAPTPPAEEVEWEPQFGDVIRGVEAGRSKYERLAYLGRAFEDSENSVYPDDLTAFTLPDGTRVRRDGERADGEPRFVKTQEEEK